MNTQVRKTNLCDTAKYCPFCFEKAKENPKEFFPIVYQRLTVGCDKVRCGHTVYDTAHQNHDTGKSFNKNAKVIPPPKLGKHKLRHGCGGKFLWSTAKSVSKAAVERYLIWHNPKQTVTLT